MQSVYSKALANWAKYSRNCPLQISSNLYCNQLHHLKTAMDKKCPSFVNRKEVTLHVNVCLHMAQLIKKSLCGTHLGEKNCFVLHILTFLFLIISCLKNYRIIWMVLGWHEEKLNMSWSQILHQNLKNL